ncbi:MDR family oxidoreductase [Stenotrophomonas sp. TWI169]|jgi:acrylyl-CoA reductase (NADPH)|uniref:Alcohol dehydrogenase n=1 Tax=Stenotrophomonas maltophilia TaxID=40324 RepID=A0AAP7GS56_STEMA|nr:MDR family oxidoreductase [Stenotrophomonas maltophilia]MBA0220092.1 oxidoreductase [Stenotrophomonas maltophilia]MBH1663660.1 oxidoreductase [Stenotrophomonas maltophilia]MBH1834360.1 oxidoreductase [Stenotrophomonas maltophilia]MCU1020169.1 oxidoreductase [Stenotrophomonas maltophilia]MDZ5840820.1 MDR family oxidoreductase [Stenotrophomonas maltophilia]
MFNAVYIDKTGNELQVDVRQVPESALPEGDVTVQVSHSTLNYKDAMAITGQGGAVVRSFPMVPGIDLAGTVLESADRRYQPGDQVVLNGWGVGERHWGGLSQLARVNADWLIPLPKGMQPEQAMAIGTAGYTAMLSLIALERHGLSPDAGEVLVTGASGGVGSFAVTLLADRGYNVVASTGRLDETDYLKSLGASEVIDRNVLSQPGKPLQRERWSAAIDSVGSHTLANVCAAIKEDGAVAACGLAQGMDFPATVAPFILRGVSLLGINSVTRPTAERLVAWERLAKDLDMAKLDAISQHIGLGEVVATAEALMAGRIRGRVVVNVNR